MADGRSDEAVRRLLRERLGSAPDDLTPLGAGEWSAAWSFCHGADELVLRTGRFEPDFRKEAFAARWRSEPLPIPEVLDVGTWNGVAFVISRRAHGTFLEALDAAAMRDVRSGVLGALDALRQADLSGTDGFGWWGPDGVGDRPSWAEALLAVAEPRTGGRLEGWRARLEISVTGAAPFERAFAELEALAHGLPDVGRHLVHSDLIHRNVLVDRGRVTAVFDWANALFGDWLYDVAWLEFYSPWHPALRELDVVSEARARAAGDGLDLTAFEERYRACALHIGLDSQAYNAAIGDWDDLADAARRTLAFVGAGP